jgi:SAM-dependent MidA family methyltransferase
LRERIRNEGPIGVEAYMEACNAYYYGTRDPLGSGGDFTTAPEITQMFGEIVGAALTDCWARAGRPETTRYVELGPGRGTLAADALRVMRSAGLRPPVHLLETSPVLRGAQAEQVPGAHWHDAVDELPKDGPLLVAANEFFDALPIRQSVAGIERRIGVAAGGLAFDRDGEIVETSPAREAVVRALARRLTDQGGVALIIDYGHERSARGDTLQAVRKHRFAHVLEAPGEQDLTSHVDFDALATAAREEGAAVSGVIEQGPWLERLGINARAARLAGAVPERAQDIELARARLCRPDAMGSLFKVMAVRSPTWPVPAGLEP